MAEAIMRAAAFRGRSRLWQNEFKVRPKESVAHWYNSFRQIAQPQLSENIANV
jgi:hypothetical protein